jgi:hypothetical protein
MWAGHVARLEGKRDTAFRLENLKVIGLLQDLDVNWNIIFNGS